MPVEAKPLFRPDVLRPHLTSFQLPGNASAMQETFGRWAGLLWSPQAETLKEGVSAVTEQETDVAEMQTWHVAEVRSYATQGREPDFRQFAIAKHRCETLAFCDMICDPSNAGTVGCTYSFLRGAGLMSVSCSVTARTPI